MLAENNQTMLGGFDFHGKVLSESTSKKLIVTGNFVFPIVNKYKSDNPRTNEPGKIIKRLEWRLNVEKFPISAKKIYCMTLIDKNYKSTTDISNCLNKKVSLTINEPNIRFNEFGLAISINAEEVSLTPFDIINKAGRPSNGL